MMDLVQARSFAQVALRGTVAAAAAALDYTPPAVSQHIGKLEAELGAALFERGGGRLRPTVAGSALLPLVLEMLDLEERSRAAATRPGDRPRVTVAGFASAVATLVVPALAELTEHMALHIVEAEDDAALRELSLGHVDVVLTQEYEGVAEDRDARFHYTPLVTDRLRLVLPADRSATTRLEELGTASWLFNGPGTRCTRAAMRLIAAAGLHPTSSGSITDNDTLVALVAAGHGVAILPELVLGGHRAGITVADQDLGIGRTILAVTRTAAGERAAALITRLARRS